MLAENISIKAVNAPQLHHIGGVVALTESVDPFAVNLRYIGLVLSKYGLWWVAALIFSSGCERAPLECAPLEPGALVITEISGDRSDDGLGQWIELYNASGTSLDLAGTRVEFTTLNGSTTDEFTVRTELNLAPKQYATFGQLQAGHIDYVFADDLTGSLLPTAAVRVFACGHEVDRVIYRNLPTVGSIALDGALAPTSIQNDSEDNFCVDAISTPQRENNACN